jgi:quercetin dioxygenase-like cupin family protein
MHVFDLRSSQHFDPDERVEKVLATVEGGDFTVACWEPGQVSPYHCHPFATEAYFCFEGGGTMRTPSEGVTVEPGGFVVHPPGELHEFENGPQRSLLYRVRYGSDVAARAVAWRTQPDWQPSAKDLHYISEHDLAKAVFDSGGS